MKTATGTQIGELFGNAWILIIFPDRTNLNMIGHKQQNKEKEKVSLFFTFKLYNSITSKNLLKLSRMRNCRR